MHSKLVDDIYDDDSDDVILVSGEFACTRAWTTWINPFFSIATLPRFYLNAKKMVSTHLTPSSYFSQFGESFDFHHQTPISKRLLNKVKEKHQNKTNQMGEYRNLGNRKWTSKHIIGRHGALKYHFFTLSMMCISIFSSFFFGSEHLCRWKIVNGCVRKWIPFVFRLTCYAQTLTLALVALIARGFVSSKDQK